MGDQLPERTRGWFQALHMSTAYNKDYPVTHAILPGGVSLWSIGQSAHRIAKSGSDPSGLGRWTWTQYQGRNDISLLVIVAYRPVVNRQSPLSAWNQQKTWLLENDDDRCPLQAFSSDLAEAVQTFQDNGHQIVLGLDVNDDIRDCDFSREMEAIQLTNLIPYHHGNDLPRTYARGSRPIDGIYVSATLINSNCGYLKFHRAFDHRACYIDIPFSASFGHEVANLVRAPARRCQPNDPRVVRKYNQLYTEKLTFWNLFNRAYALQHRIAKPLTRRQECEYEWIDRKRTAARVYADKRCRHFFAGEIPWTPTYKLKLAKLTFWKQLSRRLSGGKVHFDYLCRLRKDAGYTFELDTIHPNRAKVMMKAASQSFNKYKKSQRAKADRTDFLQQLGEARAAHEKASGKIGARTGKQWADSLIRAEQQRKDSRQIRSAEGKIRAGGLTTVIAPGPDGTRVTCDGKEAIEKACLEENQRRFNQASGNPLLKDPLYDLVGPLGTATGAQQILDGTFVPPAGTDEYLVKLIPHLQRPQALIDDEETYPTAWTLDEYQERWRKARAHTSSGPSGMHFGHCMAAAQDSDLATFEAIMANIPMVSGYSPLRFQNGTNVMLEKKKGNFNVEKLRAILLYEADFNHNNKKIGRDMMYTAERLRLIAPEQYGSRKKHASMDQSINLRLSLDILRQERQPGALCSNDAKSCYDRIIHSIASISMQRLGVPKEPIICMFSTIQNLNHYIRTVFGDSEISFGGKLWVVPVQGVGQGNGAGPQIWAAVSTPVLAMMRAEGHLAYFQAAISKDVLSFVGYAFVDDTDLIATKHHQNDKWNDVAQHLQNAVATWEGGIRATGGAIVPEKTHWYSISFKWEGSQWKYSTIRESEFQLEVQDCNGNSQVLQRLECNEASRTLGVYQAPDGNNSTQIAVLKKKAHEWAAMVKSSHLPRRLVRQAMLTTITKSLQFPLPATTITVQECRDIMKPILFTGLSKSGIVRSLKRDVVYGPKKFQGLEIPDLAMEKSLLQIQKLLTLSQETQRTGGGLLRTSIQHHIVELGIPGSFLSQNFKVYGVMVTDTWIKDIWSFLSSANLRVEDAGPTLCVDRPLDGFLMARFTAQGARGKILRSLNRCRLYLQVTCFSDIVSIDGRKILPFAWIGSLADKPIRLHTPRVIWPVQGKPREYEWILWRKALTQLGLLPQALLQPLQRTYIIREEWQWFYSRREDRLYQRLPTLALQYQVYSNAGIRSGRSAVQKFRKLPDSFDVPPADAEIADVTFQRSLACLLASTSNFRVKIDAETQLCTLRECIEKLPLDAKWAVQDYECDDNGTNIANAIISHKAIAVSDGSFKDCLGTAAWVLEGSDSSGRMIGECTSPGAPKDQSAYRSELVGLYAIITAAHAICKTHDITEGTIEVACDGISALRQSFDNSYPSNPFQQQFDIIGAIRTMLRSSPVSWKFRHVDGHMDGSKGEGKILNRWETLNCEMDERAKQRLKRISGTHHQQHPQYRICHEPWALWIGNQKVCQKLKSALKDHVNGAAISKYWDEKERFAPGSSADVDWEATGAAMKSVKLSRQDWVTKQATGQCAVNKRMLERKQVDSAKCPRCDCEIEDATHMLLCTGNDASEIWNANMESLHQWFKDQDTDPTLAKAILEGLKKWRLNPDQTPTFSTPFQLIQTAFDNQNTIGWQALLEGCPANGWSEAQQRYLSSLRKRRTGKRWLAALIVKLWDVAWDQWEHRNGINNDAAHNMALLACEEEIRQQFLLGEGNLDPATVLLLRQSQDDLLASSSANKFAWSRRVVAGRNRAARRDPREGYTHERQALARWLRVPPTNQAPPP